MQEVTKILLPCHGERQLCPVASTDRRNTLSKFLSWRLILQDYTLFANLAHAQVGRQ